MMFSTPAGPPGHEPTPLDGPELHVHPQRSHAIGATERQFVSLFLQRYIVWCARRRMVDRVKNAVDLLTEVAGTRLRAPAQ